MNLNLGADDMLLYKTKKTFKNFANWISKNSHKDEVGCVYHKKSLNEPIYVKGIPIFGNAFAIRKDPARFFYNNYRKYGPIYRVRLLNKSYTVLAGIEAVNFMGTSEGSDCLSSQKIWQGMKKEYGCKHFIMAEEGEIHQKLRIATRRGYSKECLKGRYNDLIQTTSSIIIRSWQTGQLIPVVNSIQHVLMEQTGLILMDKSPSEYIENIRRMNSYVLNAMVIEYYPKLFLKSSRYKHAKEKVFELVKHMVEDYQSGKKNHDPSYRNLIDDVMETHALQPELISANDLTIFLIGPFLAGLDTMASTVSSCIYEILKHPEVHFRICQEADDLFSKGSVDETDLLELTAINGALMETMRMRPVAGALMRTAARDFLFHGYQVQANERLYVATAVPHFMEEYYPDPEIFDINRYAKHRSEHLKAGVYSPFGRGPHICLGQMVAKLQMLLTIASVFHHLEIELESPNYKLKTRALPVAGPNLNFKIRVKRRRHNQEIG